MKEILKEVLKEIKPTKEQEKEVEKKIDDVLKKVQKALPETKVILGGSGQKGTWLKKAHDADIFVKFPINKYKEKTDSLSDILEKKLKKIFKMERLHGSRDYFQTKIKGFTFEIIPIIDIKKAENALNITDVSPLHAEWVKKHQKYVDEIRLTKQFFKAAKIYGAESYINGFSGYICEILTINYKGFENLVKSITKWKPKVVIDIENYHKNKNQALFNIDKAKTQGPLIIVDPVQSSRNAAAAVSKEKLDIIIKYSKDFIKKPSKEFFKIKQIDVESLKKKAKKDDLFILKAVPLTGKEDVVGCKLLKTFEHIKNKIEKNKFTLILSEWEWKEKAYFYFIIKKEILDKEKIVRGPPSKIKIAVKEFKKKHKDTFVKDNYLFAKDKREFRTSKKLMNSLLKDNYINERVKKLE
jgi:tRNA nucleotidyltransferase (CCA-adding enzyme)